MQDSLGDRMKSHEAAASRQLIGRMPVIIRLDGKAFHTFLAPIKGKNPHSEAVHTLMVNTMAMLCDNIQNCVFGYTQSDEISLLLRDWDTHETNQWFGGNQTKIETISASMATAIFNFQFLALRGHFEDLKLITQPYALFDSRAYNVPREDVTNYFYWRQKDAIRNSINALGQHHFPHKDLQGLNTSQVKNKLFDFGVCWDKIDLWKQRGTAWRKETDIHSAFEWNVDYEIPIFKENGRKYVDEMIEWSYKEYKESPWSATNNGVKVTQGNK